MQLCVLHMDAQRRRARAGRSNLLVYQAIAWRRGFVTLGSARRRGEVRSYAKSQLLSSLLMLSPWECGQQGPGEPESTPGTKRRGQPGGEPAKPGGGRNLRGNPATRNRTRDHLIAAKLLQSDALPTELSPACYLQRAGGGRNMSGCAQCRLRRCSPWKALFMAWPRGLSGLPL